MIKKNRSDLESVKRSLHELELAADSSETDHSDGLSSKQREMQRTILNAAIWLTDGGRGLGWLIVQLAKVAAVILSVYAVIELLWKR